MKKVVVMASGEGSNFSAIVDSGIEVAQLISDNKNANVLKRAEKAGIETRLLTPDYRGREEHEKYSTNQLLHFRIQNSNWLSVQRMWR